jgi:hypothetical protein
MHSFEMGVHNLISSRVDCTSNDDLFSHPHPKLHPMLVVFFFLLYEKMQTTRAESN